MSIFSESKSTIQVVQDHKEKLKKYLFTIKKRKRSYTVCEFGRLFGNSHTSHRPFTLSTVFFRAFAFMVSGAIHTDRNDPKSIHGQPLLNQIHGFVGCLEIKNFVSKKNLID